MRPARLTGSEPGVPFLVEGDLGPPSLDDHVRSRVLALSSLERAHESLQLAIDKPTRDLLLAIALLWHDHLEPAHALVQEREGEQDADYLHALVHRRDGDYANARYWLKRVGAHPIHVRLAECARAAALPELAPGGVWSASAMVAAIHDACAKRRDESPLIALQANELRALADHLARTGVSHRSGPSAHPQP